MRSLNEHGDKRLPTKGGFGVDVASQRMDELDQAAIDYIRERGTTGSVRPVAMDVGCAQGGQTVRMAQAGAFVVAVDIDDYETEVLSKANAMGVAEHVRFLCSDLRKIHVELRVDVLLFQRTIHFLRFPAAVDALTRLRAHLHADSRVYLSAYGLNSELAEGYSHAHRPLHERFAPLAEVMEDKHAIFGEVCLYDTEDMRALLEAARLDTLRITVSPFGNIKAIARVKA